MASCFRNTVTKIIRIR